MTNNSYIYIDEQRVTRQQFIPCGVRFELNSNNLIDINLARENNTRIQLSKDTLTNLRYYVFWISQAYHKLSQEYSEQSITSIKLPTELIFTTNYLQQQESISVIRSVINLEAKISQQIQYTLWQNPEQLNKLLNIHHWLIVQILAQLPWKRKKYLELLSWVLSFSVTAIATLLIFNLLSANVLFKVLLLLFTLLILKILMKYLLKYQLNKWIINQLLFGFFRKGTKKRNFALQLLKILE